MQKRRLVIIAFLMSLVCSCGPDIYPDFPPDTPDPQPEKGRYSAKDGVAYLYFTTHDRYDYKVYMIPFDYDNTLGSTLSIGNQSDAGRQDPFNWGNNTNLFIYRLLKNPEFREIYKEELLKHVGEDEGLFCYSASLGRIRKWQEGIGPYVSNDTGEDMVIEDKPAPWGNHGEYRLLDPGENNFFKVRSAAILNYCK